MELVKSKGMVIFLVIILSTTILGTINNKKYEEYNKSIETSYVSTEYNHTL